MSALGQREGALAAAFEEGVGEGLLAGLQRGDGLLDRALGDEAVDEDRAILADAVDAVHRLALDGGVPHGS